MGDFAVIVDQHQAFGERVERRSNATGNHIGRIHVFEGLAEDVPGSQ